eukprot:2481617-Amphidinium_carterae.2
MHSGNEGTPSHLSLTPLAYAKGANEHAGKPPRDSKKIGHSKTLGSKPLKFVGDFTQFRLPLKVDVSRIAVSISVLILRNNRVLERCRDIRMRAPGT